MCNNQQKVVFGYCGIKPYGKGMSMGTEGRKQRLKGKRGTNC
ncbi:hypothetical protein ENTCAN_07581 [Enterobacter cancerogenus ATCC 35316]|nr:hypothetical protein ENTCAN_07581 [Enterobacter cancerogenus ATCC 35316]